MEKDKLNKHWDGLKFWSFLMLLGIYTFSQLLAYWNGGKITILWTTLHNSSMTARELFLSISGTVVIFGGWAYHLIMCIVTLPSKFR